jgi:ABC-type polysaccharide/polyol phosphate transport system ATPase subunit
MAGASLHAAGLGVRFQFDRHRRVVSPTVARLRRRGPIVWGLRDIDLAIAAGEGVALVGSIGSGKTTLLRALGGILPADEGAVTVDGRIGTLLSTQAGLLSLLTGRENTLLLGVLYGLTRRETQAALDEIKDRSQLGDAFELPVATYSEGMCARLGFAVATYRPVDVLLLDEVHESLDHEFRLVVSEHAEAIRGRGGIVVAAGHDHGALEAICDRAILLEGGRVSRDGDFHPILDEYLAV